VSQEVGRRSQVEANVVANFAGHLWTAVIGLLCVPLYVKFMGVESYGLFSLCSAIMGLLLILDFGLSTAAIRETATLSAVPGQDEEIRSFLRTLECIYWPVAVLIAVSVVLASPWIAFHWISPDKLSREDVHQALLLLGVSATCRWPSRLYGGVLQGRQEQVLLNWIVGISATIRSLGSVLILWLVSPTIQAFLLCQIAGDIVETLSTKIALGRVLPKSEAPGVFDRKYLARVGRFTAGVGGTDVFYTILTQMDRLILSRLVTLETLGYYSLASVAAAALLKLVVPIGTAAFPRFAELVSQHDTERLKKTYHLLSQLVSVLSIPACLVMASFSQELLLLWTGNTTTALAGHTVLTILALATGMHVLLAVSVSLQFAAAWTSLIFTQTFLSVVLGAPLMVLLTTHFGVTGTALVWLVIHTCSFLISIPIMHRRVLVGEQRRWYIHDVGLPAVAAAVPVLFARLTLPVFGSRLLILAGLLVVSAASVVCAVLAAPAIRKEAFRYLPTIVRRMGRGPG
jgi:O-antigen/teichoic acid export membrane protein